jgi:hypothetical protein
MQSESRSFYIAGCMGLRSVWLWVQPHQVR